MPLTQEHRAELLAATQATASAFLEDVYHIRELISNLYQPRGDIRRVSGILRRLLIDNDLKTIAAPRIGKLLLSAPDNSPIYKVTKSEKVVFYVSGGVQIFGIQFRGGLQPPPGIIFNEFDPDRIILLKIDNFLTQNVIFWKGTWISRKAVIKYIAHIGHGVHSGSPATEEERMLNEIRHKVVIGRRGDDIRISISEHEDLDLKKLAFSATPIDAILLEMFSAARFLVESQSIIDLENIIRAELQK
jgi:hypothetical protein